jgi:4a-hydroxytetrahydrobiopterin dehydratase
VPTKDLSSQTCVPCEGGQPPLSESESTELLKQVSGWSLTPDKKGLTQSWKMKDFMSAMRLIHYIAALAEQEDHHPDVHLTGYRNLKIDLSTHAIGGLSKNDFILAAKIDDLPKELK